MNGLFVAAEFSLVKIRATQVDRLVEEGRTSAGLVKEATGKLDAYLAVCQLGITISSLGLGALGEPAVFGRYFLAESFGGYASVP